MANLINGLTSVQGNTPRRDKSGPAADGGGQQAAAPPPAGETVKLSAEAKQLQEIESKLPSFPEVNAERVTHLRDTLRNGDYHIDPARIAAKIVQFELDI